jgi:hypothetical protein
MKLLVIISAGYDVTDELPMDSLQSSFTEEEMGVQREYYRVRFEVLTAEPMKNTVFRDIKTQFISQSSHIISPIQCPAC